MTQKLICCPWMNFWYLAGSHLASDRKWKFCSVALYFFSVLLRSSWLASDLFFFFSSWYVIDAWEWFLRDSFDWKSWLKPVSNLQALPKLFNRVIYRSEGESLMYQTDCCPLSVSLSLPLQCLFWDLLTVQVIFASHAAICTSWAKCDWRKKDCRAASNESVLYLHSMSLCAGMVRTRSAHLTWKAARASLCWSTQLWKAQSAWVRCLNYRDWSNLASGSEDVSFLTKAVAFFALFGQDSSTIIVLGG